MPQTSDHDSVSSLINTISDDISPSAERDDQFAVADTCSRAAALWMIGQRIGSRKQSVHGPRGQQIAMWCQEIAKPIEVGPRSAQEDDLHGLGGGSSLSVPQLLTHSSTAAMGMASPVRSYSAKAASSSAQASTSMTARATALAAKPSTVVCDRFAAASRLAASSSSRSMTTRVCDITEVYINWPVE